MQEIIAVMSPSRLYALGGSIFFVMLAMVFLYFGKLLHSYLSLAAIPLFLLAFIRYLSIVTIKYTLTKETLMIRTGILNYEFNNLELFRVIDYTKTQNIFFRIFALMTITLYTSDKTNATVHLKGIAHSNIAEIIRDLVRSARNKNNIMEIN